MRIVLLIFTLMPRRKRRRIARIDEQAAHLGITHDQCVEIAHKAASRERSGRYVVHADDFLTAFLELERQSCPPVLS